MTRDSAIVSVAVAGSVVLLAQLVDFGYGKDQGIYAAVAQAIRDGGAPYRDAWDFKPPGIFFVYAAAASIFGTSVHAIRWLEAAGLMAMVVAFAELSRLYLDDARPGVIGGALALVGHVQLEFWHTGQPESFGVVVVAWMLVFAAHGLREASLRRRALWWAAAGVAAGCGVVLKPTVGVAALSPIAIAVTRWRADGRRSSLRLVLGSFAAGAVMVGAACAGFFWLRGALSDLVEALFVFAPRYASLAWGERSAVGHVVTLARMSLLSFAPVIPVGVVLLAVIRGLPARPGEGLWHVGGAVVLLLVGVLVQGRYYPYHFASALALAGLLAGWGWWRLWHALRGTWHGAAAVAVLFTLLLSLKSGTFDLRQTFRARCLLRLQAWSDAAARPAIRDRLYSVVDYWAPDNRAVAEWVTKWTEPDEPIFVYGFVPEIYARSRRRPASRYVYDVPLRTPSSRARARAGLMADLDRSIPAAVIVEHGNFGSRVTGLAVDSATDFSTFDELQAFVARHYVQEPSIGKFDVYRRIS